jgi:hypothetical protein
VSVDGALECISASEKNRASSGTVARCSEIKARIQEYRYLNVSHVIGGNVTALQLYVRRSRSAGETSAASQSFAPAETLFYSVVVDREGVSSRTLMCAGTTSPTSYRNGAFRIF